MILVVFDRKSFVLSEKLVSGIDAFLEEHEVEALEEEEYRADYAAERRRERIRYGNAELLSSRTAYETGLPQGMPDKATLEEFLNKEEDSFRERLFRLIDEKGLSDPEVYTRACIDRKVFSKIRCNPDYQPKKSTAFALAIALELNKQEMLDLLSRAGLTFSPSNTTDLIIEYFVTHHNYNVQQIDAALFHYDQPTLFSDE